MLAQGLEPDFSAAAAQQLRTIGQAAMESGPQIRDLRARLWCSIDNDERATSISCRLPSL